MTSPFSSPVASDKRASVRMNVAYSAEYRVTGTEQVEHGQVLDLSAGGFLIESASEIEPGTGIAITLHSSDSEVVTAAWVLRCSRSGADGRYRVACAFDG